MDDICGSIRMVFGSGDHMGDNSNDYGLIMEGECCWNFLGQKEFWKPLTRIRLESERNIIFRFF